MNSRISNYMNKIQPAISGSGGHSQMFKTAITLVQDFNLSVSEAMQYLQEYNRRCLPPFSYKELEYKLNSAYKNRNISKVGRLNNARKRK